MSPLDAFTYSYGGCTVDEVDIPALFQPNPQAVPVFDPALKPFGTLWVPSDRVVPTPALLRPVTEHPSPTICLLHLKGTCRFFESCNQVHVDPHFAYAVREALLALPTNNCCFAHGDVPTCRRDFQALIASTPLTLALEDGVEVTVPAERLAVTKFWDQFMANGTTAPLKFNAARVCRLHQRNACKFAMDCNNLHICRDFWASVRRMAPSPPIGPAPAAHANPSPLRAPQLGVQTWPTVTDCAAPATGLSGGRKCSRHVLAVRQLTLGGLTPSNDGLGSNPTPEGRSGAAAGDLPVPLLELALKRRLRPGARGDFGAALFSQGLSAAEYDAFVASVVLPTLSPAA